MRVELPVSYEEAVERATAALKTEGFGVLTTIDVKATIKQKLDKDFRKYVDPRRLQPADRLRGAERRNGHRPAAAVQPDRLRDGAEDRSVVAAVAPLVTLGRVGNEALAPLGARGGREAAARAGSARKAAKAGA